MAYPSNYNGGQCPDSHPQPVISLFYEFMFDTGRFGDMWYGSKQPFVYAMGDDTGYGFHGDFVSLPSPFLPLRPSILRVIVRLILMYAVQRLGPSHPPERNRQLPRWE